MKATLILAGTAMLLLHASLTAAAIKINLVMSHVKKTISIIFRVCARTKLT